MTLQQEREQLEAAIAERQRQIDAAETQAWCEQQNERARSVETVVTKTAPPATTRRDSQAMTNEWQTYIQTEARAAERRAITAVAEAVGEMLAEERKKMRAELQTEVLKLRNEFLQAELDRERGVRRQASPLSVHSIEELN
jgi:hypothetical protein